MDLESNYGSVPQMILSDSVVENNTAQNPGFHNANGGGIENGTYLELDNTTVAANRAGTFPTFRGLGGGIANGVSGRLVMNGGSIRNNSAGNEGGGLSNEFTATLNGVAVTGNHANDLLTIDAGAAGQGGGIYSFQFSTLHLAGGSVAGNGAGHDGGGLAVFTHDLEVDGSTVAGNVAGGASGCPGLGGGIYMDLINDVPPTLTLPHPGIHGSRISGNNALDATSVFPCAGGPVVPCLAQGGGIRVINASLAVDGGTHVDGNRACDGGGMYLGNAGGLTFSGTALHNTASAHGGAMFVAAGSAGAVISASRVVGNRARQTGGIYNLGPVTIRTSLVSGNMSSPTCVNLLSPCL
jgi:hypothetical protein